jgi:general stress protein YciG
MSKELDDAVRSYLARIARKGGKARAAKYDKATLKRWARKGGRPKKGLNKGKTA